MNWIATPTGQLKFAMWALCFQVAICSIIVIGSVFEGRTDEDAFGFCLCFLFVGSGALYFMKEVLKFLKRTLECDADKSEDS